MESPWLYCNTVPVLLGTAEDAPAAGRLAKRLFRRHHVVCCWLGQRLSLNLLLFARRIPVWPDNPDDSLCVCVLRDFAAAPEQRGRLLALIPCSAAAEEFLGRCEKKLSTDYVLLSGRQSDPLEELLPTEQPAPSDSVQAEEIRS